MRVRFPPALPNSFVADLFGKRAHLFDRFTPYVWERWQQGCHNGTLIWQELAAQGYTGFLKSVYQFLRPLRQALRPGFPAPAASSAARPVSLAQTRVLPRSPLDR